jgi:pilus assembly protein CpaB
MNTPRIVVLTIALSAGGVAAYLPSGSDNKPLPTEPVAQLQTKSDISLGQTVAPENLQWQTSPAATASNSFIRRNQRPDATTMRGESINVISLWNLELDDDTEVIEGRPT